MTVGSNNTEPDWGDSDQLDSDDSGSDHNHLPWYFVQGQSSCWRHDGLLVNLNQKQRDFVI